MKSVSKKEFQLDYSEPRAINVLGTPLERNVNMNSDLFERERMMIRPLDHEDVKKEVIDTLKKDFEVL